MNRHFKKEMAKLIQAGLKTATTRYKAWKVQEVSNAVVGSRYKPIKFGTIKVNSVIKTTWEIACRAYFKQEGFNSPEEMRKYIIKEKLVRGTLDDEVFIMEFEYYRNASDIEVK